MGGCVKLCYVMLCHANHPAWDPNVGGCVMLCYVLLCYVILCYPPSLGKLDLESGGAVAAVFCLEEGSLEAMNVEWVWY